MCLTRKIRHLILKTFYCFFVHTRDAALMISNYLCGSEEEFVKKMNEKASSLGMKDTTFVNSSGLDEKINSLEENKRKLIEEEQNEQPSEKNFEDFKKKINDMVLSDDEKILELAQLMFDDIKVESIKDDETDQKVILHAKLNVFDSQDQTFNFENFLLLFCSHQRCGLNDKQLLMWQ